MIILNYTERILCWVEPNSMFLCFEVGTNNTPNSTLKVLYTVKSVLVRLFIDVWQKMTKKLALSITTVLPNNTSKSLTLHILLAV